MNHIERQFKSAKLLATLLDTQFSIGGIRFGIDPIVSTIPWIGSVIGVLLSIYILKIGYDVGVSKLDMIKMIGNLAIDFLVGAIPFVGVIFDIAYKANIKNLKIIEKYMGRLRTDEKVVEGEVVERD